MNGMLRLTELVAHERAMLHKNWGWFVALGLALAAMGIAALVFVGMATLVAVVFVGWMFLIGGILEVAHAIARKGWCGFWLDLLSGVITALAGLFIVMNPRLGASVFTIMLGVMFLISGIFRIAAGIGTRNPYAGWFVLNGIISAILGIMILAKWPNSLLWVIGTLVGIDLLVEGLRLVSLGMAAKNLTAVGGDSPGTTGATA